MAQVLSPTPEDYSYCTLCLAGSEFFVGDDEPSRFVHTLDGRIEISIDDGNESLTVGLFTALIVDLESAINEGVHPFEVFDSTRKTAPFYAKLFRENGWGGPDFRTPVVHTAFGEDAPWRPNLLILDRLAVFPEHRGNGIGLLALRGLIERFRMGIGLIAMKPFPLQFEAASNRPEDVQERARLGLDQFSIGHDKALAKLRSYYASLGFRQVPRTGLMVLAPERYVREPA